jgi:ankyrin repeat protein
MLALVSNELNSIPRKVWHAAPNHWLNATIRQVSRLMAMGADKNAKNANGETPLHIAADHGHVETVTALVMHGADKEATDANGDTPLHYAASNGHEETVETLQDL